MNHIKLFENFEDMPMEAKEQFLIGYYGEGGYGSHPTIVTESELIRCGFSQHGESHFLSSESSKMWTHKDKSYLMFIETSKSPTLPGALACAYNDNYLWDIKGISESIGQEIMDMIGDDTITSFGKHNQKMLNTVEDMLSLPKSSKFGAEAISATAITIIPNPAPNTVYWSDTPEMTHSYWMPPYKSMSLEELVTGKRY